MSTLGAQEINCSNHTSKITSERHCPHRSLVSFCLCTSASQLQLLPPNFSEHLCIDKLSVRGACATNCIEAMNLLITIACENQMHCAELLPEEGWHSLFVTSTSHSYLLCKNRCMVAALRTASKRWLAGHLHAVSHVFSHQDEKQFGIFQQNPPCPHFFCPFQTFTGFSFLGTNLRGFLLSFCSCGCRTYLVMLSSHTHTLRKEVQVLQPTNIPLTLWTCKNSGKCVRARIFKLLLEVLGPDSVSFLWCISGPMCLIAIVIHNTQISEKTVTIKGAWVLLLTVFPDLVLIVRSDNGELQKKMQ